VCAVDARRGLPLLLAVAPLCIIRTDTVARSCCEPISATKKLSRNHLRGRRPGGRMRLLCLCLISAGKRLGSGSKRHLGIKPFSCWLLCRLHGVVPGHAGYQLRLLSAAAGLQSGPRAFSGLPGQSPWWWSSSSRSAGRHICHGRQGAGRAALSTARHQRCFLKDSSSLENAFRLGVRGVDFSCAERTHQFTLFN